VIITAGVLVDQELAADVARALAAWVRADATRYRPEVARLVAELEVVSARPSVRVRPLDDDEGPTEGVAEAARRLGVSARTVRRWCASDRLPATRRDGRWVIRRSGSERLSA
jgi:excisionase family DNA binding protein